MKLKKLLYLLVAVIASLSLSACTSSAKTDTPENVVKSYLDAMKTGDIEKAKTYVDSESESTLDTETTDTGVETMKALLSNLQYEIISSEVNEDTAVVKAKIKNVDMKTVMTEMFSQAFTLALSGTDEELQEEQMEKLIVTSIENNKENLLESEVDINLKKTENGWLIVLDDKVVDAIVGGMISFANGITDTLNGIGAE